MFIFIYMRQGTSHFESWGVVLLEVSGNCVKDSNNSFLKLVKFFVRLFFVSASFFLIYTLLLS